MAHDLAACLSVFPNKPNKIQDITTNKQKYRQTTIYALSCGEKLSPKVNLWRKNDKYQVWIQGVVARDIVFRFPNIQKKHKRGKALLFVRLLSFLSNYSNSNYTLKQTKNNTKQKQTNKQKRRELLPERSTSRHCCCCGRRQFYCPTMALFISWRFYIFFIVVLYLIFHILLVRNVWGLVMAFENKTCLHKTTQNLGTLWVQISPWIRAL